MIIVKYDGLCRIPQHIGLDDGAMCTGIASAIHACKRASLDKNSKVAIIGTGFMGIAIVLTCKMMGIKNIFVIGTVFFFFFASIAMVIHPSVQYYL